MHTNLRRIARAIAVILTCLVVLPALPSSAVARSSGHAKATGKRTGASNISITAVYYDPHAGADPDTNAGRNQEYVLVHNSGSRAVRLRGWTLRDLARTGQPAHVFHFPRFKLRGGRTVRIHTGPGTDTNADLYWGSSVYVWGDDSDRVTLKTKAGTTVDTCTWGPTDTSPMYC